LDRCAFFEGVCSSKFKDRFYAGTIALVGGLSVRVWLSNTFRLPFGVYNIHLESHCDYFHIVIQETANPRIDLNELLYELFLVNAGDTVRLFNG